MALGVIGGLVLLFFIAIGALVYGVTRHIKTQPATATSAVKTFDDQRAQFQGQSALFTLDDLDHPENVHKRVQAIPAGNTPASELCVLVWSPDSQKTVNVSLPFWLLKMGRRKINIQSDEDFEFEKFNVDVDQLERIGPHFIADLQKPGGERVLIWTK